MVGLPMVENGPLSLQRLSVIADITFVGHVPTADVSRCSKIAPIRLVGGASIWALEARAERSRVASQI